ncbi:MAG: polyphenol oxidase family protein [Acidimicrobiales bacterium]
MPVHLTLRAERRGGLTVYPVTARTDAIDAFVTSRAGGVSDPPYDSLNLGEHVGDDPERVAENRRRVARAAGVTPDALLIARQVHGADVVVVPHARGPVEADGQCTDADDVAVAILVADCVPVLLADATSSWFGVVHAGWRGLAAGVLEAAVARFDDPTTLRAVLGPSISASRYQVGPEVAGLFADVPGATTRDVGDRWRLDLGQVVVRRLAAAGLSDDRVDVLDASTDDTTRFFSDRAQRPTGRIALVARRRSMSAP